MEIVGLLLALSALLLSALVPRDRVRSVVRRSAVRALAALRSSWLVVRRRMFGRRPLYYVIDVAAGRVASDLTFGSRAFAARIAEGLSISRDRVYVTAAVVDAFPRDRFDDMEFGPDDDLAPEATR